MGARLVRRHAGAMTTASLATPLPASPRRSRIGRRYGRMWARVPRELGYLALTAVIGIVVFSTANGVLSIGSGGALLVVIGVVLLALLLLGSRYVGTLELIRLRWARTPAIAAPAWTPPFRGKRPLRALGDVFGNGHYWLSGLHTAVANPLLAFVTFIAWFGWLAIGVALVSFALWGERLLVAIGTSLAIPDNQYESPVTLVKWFASQQSDPSVIAWVTAGASALGLLMLALFPFVTRGATLAHWGLGRLLLARFRSEDLALDVARADAARTAAVAAEDTALRRLERDIHDGPQQRLLALQMELSTAERRIESGGDATESVEAARRIAAETLDELRALAQGFAPPLLQDRGLSAALGALGRRGAVPVETSIAISGQVPEPVERSVYFIAAEFTANAVKHARASRIRLDASTEETPRVLVLTVTDDGVGGAAPEPGHGLEGATGRLTGLGGTLTVTSPAGGGTTAVARVPLP